MAQHVRRCSMQLYLALQVPPNSPPEAVQQAYDAKKEECKPQEGEDASERFQEVEEAGEILLDPSRRRMYDIFGRAGMRTIEGGIGAEYADLIVSNIHRLRWIVLLVAYFWLMWGVEIIVLIRKVDEHDGWSWGAIFIPIWIIDTLIGGAALGLLYEMLRAPSKVPMYIVMFTTLASFVLSTIFICMALSGLMSWHAAFLPVLVLLGAYVVAELKDCDVRKFRDRLRLAGDPDADDIGVTSQQFLAYCGNIAWRIVTLGMFVLLLYLKVTDQTNADYYLVFLPLFLYMWMPLIWRIFELCCTNRIVRNLTDRMIMTFMLLFTYLASFLTIGLLAIKCHQADLGETQVSLVYVMIPPMIIVVLLTMLFCGIALFMPSSMMQLGAADAFDAAKGDAMADDTPLMQMAQGAATANQFQYAAQAASRGDVSGASSAASDAVRMARGERQQGGYGSV